MKKSKLSILLAALLFSANVFHPASALQENEAYEHVSFNDYIFVDTPEETINQMKMNIELSNLKSKTTRLSLTSLMAKAFDASGFNNVAEALDYSMLEYRPDRKIYGNDSLLVNDIWSYSPDFRDVMQAFLYEARRANSYEYFKSTSMNFNMPDINLDILNDTQLRKQTDIFGTLHAVNINLGVIKENGKWHILVNVMDTFDFAKEDYNKLVNVVNNIAYYEQELGKVKPYYITIYGDRPNLYKLPFGMPTW